MDNGIEGRIFRVGSLGLRRWWCNRLGTASFPVADRIHPCGFFLPINTSLTPEDFDWSQVALEAA